MSRARQKRATRARLLEVARASFERDGFEGTTLRAIAKEAGVAVGTVFVHFTDKSDLLHSALFEDVEAAVQHALDTAPADVLLARVMHLTAAMFDYYRARPELSRVLLKESLRATGVWQQRFVEQVGRVHAVVAQWIAEARDAGEVAPDFDPQVGAAAYFSFYYFALLNWIKGSPLEPVSFVESLFAQHIRSGT